jgi:tetraacyldisaccharide 4'-kinase
MRLKGLKRALLWLPAKLYELLVRLRIAAYETNYLTPKRISATVISVGNITLGGTGKTPLVEYIARYLSQEGYSVAILTRGYGRSSSGMKVLRGHQASALPWHYREFGDEPLMLARALPDVPIIVNEKRYEGARFAERSFGSEVLILDDGYQHLRLARDLNILVLDATDPFGGFEMVPFGRLREPLYALNRADLIIINRAHRPFDQAQTLAVIGYICGDQMPIFYTYPVITALRHLRTGRFYGIEQFSGWRASVLCGIGNPRAFCDDLADAGIQIASEHFFADHHPFTQADLDRATEGALAAQADMIVTTEKDAVRLEFLSERQVPVYSAKLELRSEDEIKLKSMLLRALLKRGPINKWAQ